MVELTGRVEARAWSDSEGNTRTGLNFNTATIKVHGGGERPAEDPKQDNPVTAKGKGSRNAKQQQDDDLPF